MQAIAATLEDLAWLAGHWSSKEGGATAEEYWLPPAGGLMLGLHRDVFASGKAFFEYLRIESRDDSVFYMASPGGKPPTPFKLVEAAPGKAVFANPEHDFPKRISYWVDHGGALHARVEGDPSQPDQCSEWVWNRSGGHAPA